jgi:hypothetical protein
MVMQMRPKNNVDTKNNKVSGQVTKQLFSSK